MKQDIERLKDICAKEGFDLIKQDGRYYIEQSRNRVIYSKLKCDNQVSYFDFRLSKPDEIKYLKEELEAFLTNQLIEFLNNDAKSNVVIYPTNTTFTR
jgi:hypothetical protein